MPANILNVTSVLNQGRIRLVGDMGVAFDTEVDSQFSVSFFTVDDQVFEFTTAFTFVDTKGRSVKTFNFGGSPSMSIELMYDAADKIWYVVKIGSAANVPHLVSSYAWDTDVLAADVVLSATTTEVTSSAPNALTAAVRNLFRVTKVDFYRDEVLIGSAATAPYKVIDLLSMENNGTVTYSAKMYDINNRITTSNPLSVNVNIPPPPPPPDITPPTIDFSVSTTNVTEDGPVDITVTATDEKGVAKVDIYCNNAVVSTQTVAPFTYTDNLTYYSNGSRSYKARAYDTSNNYTDTPTVVVTVNITPPSDLEPFVMDQPIVDAANAAIAAADSGPTKKGKRLAAAQAIVNIMDPSHILNIYRDGILTITATFIGSMTVNNDGPDYTNDDSLVGDIEVGLNDIQNGSAVADGDINTGHWTFVLTGGSNQYKIVGSVGPENSAADIILGTSPFNGQVFDTVVTFVLDRSIDGLTA